LVTSCVGTLSKHVVEGKIEGMNVTGKRGRRLKQLLDDFKETTEYWKLIKKHQIALCGELAV
jgi:hypothetical protein